MNRLIAILLLFLYASSIFAQAVPSAGIVSGSGITVSNNLTDVDAMSSNSVELAMSSADYMVTAGDVYTLSFAAGNTPVSYTIPVD